MAPITSPLIGETQILSLPKGASLLFRPNTVNDIATLVLVFPMGSREEPPDMAGLTTLALRMISRGTRTKNDFEVAVALESIGASFSTDVQKDRATVTIHTTGAYWQETMDIVREILTEPSFPEEDFEIEREILIKEIREDLDSPYATAYRLFQRTLFAGHPYGHPGGGTEDSVASLKLEAVKDSYFSRFGGFPLSFGVVGNLDMNQVRDGLANLVEDLPRGDTVTLQTARPVATRESANEVYERRATGSECMVYGFPTPGLHDERYPAWKVLDSIVGGSMDSRLFTEIREKEGLVYQIGSSYPPLEWQGFFGISLMSTRQNHDKILFHLEKEIDRLKDTLPDPDELERAKTYLKGTFMMSQERCADQAHLLARYHSLGLGVSFIDQYPSLLDAVTAEDIQSIAREHLHHPVLAIVGPGDEEESLDEVGPLPEDDDEEDFL